MHVIITHIILCHKGSVLLESVILLIGTEKQEDSKTDTEGTLDTAHEQNDELGEVSLMRSLK